MFDFAMEKSGIVGMTVLTDTWPTGHVTCGWK